MTRRVTAHLFHSVDGVAESPNLWQFDAFGPEEGQLMGETLGSVTDVVIGAKLWREWSEFWPQASDPFGQFINPVPKHVVSTTLRSELQSGGDLGWNSTVIEGDPISFVRGLRESDSETDGGDIAVVGGIETVRSLFLGGVIDELTLTTHPVLAGAGRRLFEGVDQTTRLRLLRARQTSAGNAILTYAPFAL